MKYARWTGGAFDLMAAQRLRDAGYPALLSDVLAARGVTAPEETAPYLERERQLTYSPMLMKDMDRAVARIEKALAQGERIAVFGDYDVDGITATVLLVDYLRSRGADCLLHIPRRIEDGYGLGCDALRSLRDQGVDLVITVDCGITGVEEARFCREIGLDLVVTDHHECKDVLPEAVAVVDPRRPDCPYPFKRLAGVGVALKLVLALGRDRAETLFDRYCTLAAIGTVADVMTMSDENRTIVSRGLESIANTDFLGLRALLRETGLLDKAVTSIQIGFVLAPRINAAGRMGEAELAAHLLLTRDPAKAEELARELCDLNRERQSVEQEIFAQAVEKIETLPKEERSALVLSSEVWHQGVVGIVASRLSEKYACPSFMIHLNGDVGKGSCRSYGGFNLFAALEQCQELLLGFGGHELAAGFTIERGQIPAFREKMNAIARAFLGGGCPVSSVEIDALIHHPNLLNLGEVEQLAALEPYGADNPRPLFCIQGLTVDSLQNVGQNKHLKLRFSKGTTQLDGIFFSANTETCGVGQGDRVDAAFYLNINEFRSSRTLQMQLVDVRLSREPSVREREDLEKMRRFLDGEGVTGQEAAHMLPERAQFAACWRWLDRTLPAEDAWQAPWLPLLRSIEKHLGGVDPFQRAMTCLAVFCERGLLQIEGEGDERTLRRLSIAEKADLSASPYMQTLQMIMQSRR